jgi:hypothetical protein
MTAEDNLNGIEDLGFNVINVRKMTATRGTLNRQTHMESPQISLATLQGNTKSLRVFKLKMVLRSATTAKTLAMSGPTASNQLQCVVRW